MASGSKSYITLTPKLVASFEMPDDYRAMGIATVGGSKAWVMIFNLPMVCLVDSTGHIYQTRYAVEEMRKMREKNATGSMYEEAKSNLLFGEDIAADDKGNCFITISKNMDPSVKLIHQSGTVSTVISGLKDQVDGIAYISESKGKGRVLFGYHTKGLHSIKWPKGFMSRVISPNASEVFFFESMFPLSVSVDKNSDMICVGDLSSKVFVINREGHKVAEYVPEDKDKFLPDCVVFDHTGCIIVLNTNKNVNSVIRLTPDGQQVQTLFPEINEKSKLCGGCKKLKIPKCKECKEKVRILAIGVDGDNLWVSRSSGEVEIYRLL